MARFEYRSPMKNSKSNTKISVAKDFFWGILVTTYQPTFIAYLNSFSASRCNHNEHRESTYVMVNRSNTLQNTFMELAEYKDSSCRLLRHSKISAPVHSLKWNSTLPPVHRTQPTSNLDYLDKFWTYILSNVPAAGGVYHSLCG